MITNILSFLNSNIAEKFEANFRAQNTQNSFSEFIVSKGSTVGAVCKAFTWNKTPEGYHFWDTVEDLWMEFLKKGGEPMPENQEINTEALKLLI